jgi:hypothetical protein
MRIKVSPPPEAASKAAPRKCARPLFWLVGARVMHVCPDTKALRTYNKAGQSNRFQALKALFLQLVFVGYQSLEPR